jgi:hypothetical protein
VLFSSLIKAKWLNICTKSDDYQSLHRKVTQNQMISSQWGHNRELKKSQKPLDQESFDLRGSILHVP